MSLYGVCKHGKLVAFGISAEIAQSYNNFQR